MASTGDDADRGAPRGPGAEAGARSRRGAAGEALRSASASRARTEREEVRRFTRHTRRRRSILVSALVLVGATLAALAVVLFTPLLSVREVRVEGAGVDQAAIHDALVDLEGTPLTLVGDSSVADRLASFVDVQSWSTRVDPPGTLVVEIVPRTPVGVVTDDVGRPVVVDAAGVALTLDPASAGVPTLGLGGASIDSEPFRSAAAVSAALPADFRATVRTIEAHSTDDVRLTLSNGTSVVWGSADQSTRKAQVLAALVAAIGPAGRVSQYDVSSPEAPVTR